MMQEQRPAKVSPNNPNFKHEIFLKSYNCNLETTKSTTLQQSAESKSPNDQLQYNHIILI